MLVPTIATERLKLRAYELSDVPDLARLIGTHEVAEDLLRVRYPYREQDAREFVLSMEESTEARFAITLAKQSSLIGGIGLRIDPQHPRAELGYWLGMPYLGKGLCHGSGACHGRAPVSRPCFCIAFTRRHSGKTLFPPRCSRKSA